MLLLPLLRYDCAQAARRDVAALRAAAQRCPPDDSRCPMPYARWRVYARSAQPKPFRQPGAMPLLLMRVARQQCCFCYDTLMLFLCVATAQAEDDSRYRDARPRPRPFTYVKPNHGKTTPRTRYASDKRLSTLRERR